MQTLQDLLSNISSLRKASDNFQEQLGNLKDSFGKVSIPGGKLNRLLLRYIRDGATRTADE